MGTTTAMAIFPPLPNPPPPEEAPLVASTAPADVVVVEEVEVVGFAEGTTVSVVMICVILVRVSPSVVMIWTLVKVSVLGCCVVVGDAGVDVVGGAVVELIGGGCCVVEVVDVDDDGGGGGGIAEDDEGEVGRAEEVVLIGGCTDGTEVVLMIVVGPGGAAVVGSLTVAVFRSAGVPGAVVPSGPDMPVLVLLLDMLKT